MAERHLDKVSKGGPFDQLLGLVKAMSGEAGDGATPRPEQLRRFLANLTERERAQVIARMVKLPRAEQAEIHQAVVQHAYWLSSAGPAGPGAPLLQELLEALNAQVDALPDPGLTGRPSRTAEEWRASHSAHLATGLIQCGWPEVIARAAAEDLTRLDEPKRTVEQWAQDLVTAGASVESATEAAKSAHEVGRFYAETSHQLGRDLDDVMRDEFINSGMSTESANAMTSDSRRNRKWLAASNAALPAKLLADQRSVEDAIRKGCRSVAKHADAIAATLAALGLERKPDRAAARLREVAMGKLISAITAALPHSPAVFEIVQRAHPGAKGSPYQWYEAASATDEIVDAIAEGGSPNRAPVAARTVKAIANEARTWGEALNRGRGRPTKRALRAPSP